MMSVGETHVLFLGAVRELDILGLVSLGRPSPITMVGMQNYTRLLVGGHRLEAAEIAAIAERYFGTECPLEGLADLVHSLWSCELFKGGR